MSLQYQITTALDRELDCLQHLLDILQQEREALLAADIDDIERLTATKNRALAAQNEAMLSRQEVASQSPFGNTADGLQQLIASCENSEALGDSYSRLNELAQQCQSANRANGRLIAKRQQHALGALNVIRQTGSSTATYSGQGATTSHHATRSLGKA